MYWKGDQMEDGEGIWTIYANVEVMVNAIIADIKANQKVRQDGDQHLGRQVVTIEGDPGSEQVLMELSVRHVVSTVFDPYLEIDVTTANFFLNALVSRFPDWRTQIESYWTNFMKQHDESLQHYREVTKPANAKRRKSQFGQGRTAKSKSSWPSTGNKKKNTRR